MASLAPSKKPSELLLKVQSGLATAVGVAGPQCGRRTRSRARARQPMASDRVGLGAPGPAQPRRAHGRRASISPICSTNQPPKLTPACKPESLPPEGAASVRRGKARAIRAMLNAQLADGSRPLRAVPGWIRAKITA